MFFRSSKIFREGKFHSRNARKNKRLRCLIFTGRIIKHNEQTRRKNEREKKNTTAVLRLNSSHLIPEFLRKKTISSHKKSILVGIPMFFFLFSKRSLSRNIRRQMYVPTKISRSLKMRITALQRLSKRQIELGTEI